ncbi:MAG TPA: hypothetical protein DCX95_04030 [Elusimicrobia bacterium]|nr:hypothetical protein [Elusimicrobiota bacterium]
MIFVFLFILGFISLGFQTLLLREFLVIFSDNELIIGIFLFNWMLTVGIASYIGEIFVKRIGNIKKIFEYLVFSSAFIIPANIFLVGFLRRFFQKTPTEMLGLLSAFSFSFFAVFLVCLIFGLWFVYCVNMLNLSGRSVVLPISRLYAVEIAGCVFGGFLTSILLVRYFSPLLISLIFSALIFISLSVYFSKRYLLFLILIVPLFYKSDSLEKFLISHQWKPFNVLETKDSIYGKITVLKNEDAIDFYENSNKVYSTVSSAKDEEITHIPLLLSYEYKNILLLGGGLNDIREISKYPVKKIVYVEQNSVLVELLKKYADDRIRSLLGNSRVKVISADGRFFIKRTTDKYDCVILDASPPLTGLANRYFTKEFFLEVKNILSEKGLFIFPLLSSENYMSDEQKELTASVFKTVKSVFSYCEVIPASNNYFICSSEKHNITSEMIKRKIAGKNIELKYLTRFYIDYILRYDRLENLEQWVNEKQKEVSYNTDFRPVSYLYGLKLWLSFFGDASLKLFSKTDIYSAANTIFVSMISLYFFIVLLFVRIKKRLYESVVVVVSCASMVLALAIIFAFQSVYGYVYQKIGVLLAVNLLGIGVGSFLSKRFLEKTINTVKLTIICMALFSLILTFISINKLFVSEYLFYLFVSIAGFFIGFIFPLAVTENRIGKFYALDLLGALIGSVLVSLIFIPLFGITATCFFVALCLFLLIFFIFFVK